MKVEMWSTSFYAPPRVIPVGKIAEKAVSRSVFFNLSAELTKTHSFRLLKMECFEVWSGWKKGVNF